MNTILSSDPLSAPHLLVNPRLSPSHPDPFHSHNMSTRKRKASEEPDHDRMSTSPSASPSLSNRPLASSNTHRSLKRTRINGTGSRPLALPRLLETLSAQEMRELLRDVCDHHPGLHQEIITMAPRPSVDSTLAVLGKYEDDFRAAFPLGNRPTSDYAYNRVRQHLQQLIDALRDYTPHFLPPQEPQTGSSLAYLDAVTHMLHRLPDWDTFQYQRHKHEAYDEIARAWAVVMREAAKRAGGFHLQLGEWDQKLVEHDQKSGGRLRDAVHELKASLGFPSASAAASGSAGAGISDERASIRQQLFSGTYGSELGVGSGRW